MAAITLPKKCQDCACETNAGVHSIQSTNEWFLEQELDINQRKIDVDSIVFYCNKCYINKSLGMNGKYQCVNCHVYVDDFNMPNIKKGQTVIGGNGGIGFFEFTVAFDQLPDHLQCEGSICHICLIKLYQDGIVKRQNEASPWNEDGYKFDEYYLKTVERTIQNYNDYPSKCRTCEKSIVESAAVYFIPTLNQYFLQKDVFTQNRNIDSKRVLVYCDNCYVRNSLRRNNCYKCTNCHIYNNITPSISIEKGKLTSGLYEFVDLPKHLGEDADICSICFDDFIEKQLVKKVEAKPAGPTWNTIFNELSFIGGPEQVLKRKYSIEFIDRVYTYAQRFIIAKKNKEKKEHTNDLVATFNKACDLDDKYRLVHKIIEMTKIDEETSEIESAVDFYNKNKGKKDVYCHKCHKQWDADDKTEFVKGGVKYWAIFKESRIFTHMGRQILTSEEIKSDTYPVEVCNTCLKGMTYEQYLSVPCDYCHKLHMDMMHHSGGVGCSSSVGELGIFGGDGSDYDQSRLTWVDGVIPDSLRKVREICDGCIKKLLETGIVEYKYHSQY